MAGSLFVINIEGHYTYTVMPSQRLVSCDVIDIGNLIMCRTFGSMIVVLFRICSFARGKGSLKTMSYLTILDCRHGFWSMLKLFQFLHD